MFEMHKNYRYMVHCTVAGVLICLPILLPSVSFIEKSAEKQFEFNVERHQSVSKGDYVP